MSSATYLVIDTETTGLNPLKNGIIQIAALAVNDKLEILATFNQDVCPPPETEFCPVAATIYSLTPERIASGNDYDKVCVDFADFIKKNFSRKPVVIGQFYPFDYAFLSLLMVKCDLFKDNLLGNDFVDTKALVNFANLKTRFQNSQNTKENNNDESLKLPLPFPITSLSAKNGLKDQLKITDFTSHDALGDCLATLEVVRKFVDFSF
jgi:DNA polymerase III epsilon subunit-like protein